MKASNIKCNGISNTIAAKSSIPTINTAIYLFRMRFEESEIFEKFPKNDECYYYSGSRFNDNNTVSLRIASALVDEAKKELRCTDNSIIDGYINTFINSLNGKEMDQLIIEGMRDCASADHWYKFERYWD
jgi:hypothetical protein